MYLLETTDDRLLLTFNNKGDNGFSEQNINEKRLIFYIEK